MRQSQIEVALLVKEKGFRMDLSEYAKEFKALADKPGTTHDSKDR